MKKLLVINSFGPMGSTLLAPVAEKLGFINLPLRKTNLSQYLLGQADINSGLIQKRLEDILIEHAKPSQRGGVGKMARQKQAPHALIKYTDDIQKELEALKSQKFDSVQSLYIAIRALYTKAVTYKNVKGNQDWHIELTTDIHRYDPDTIFNAYKKHFDNVYMIHLTRDFRGWFNSLASMAAYHPELKQRLMFFPHLRYKDFECYNNAISRMPGLFIDFEELFTTKTNDLAQKIATFTETPMANINFEQEDYDLYGKILPHNIAFKKFDDNIHYIRPATLDYIVSLKENGRMNCKFEQFTSWIRYLIDMSTYKNIK